GVLDRDQNAIHQPAGRQIPARKILGSAASGQRDCNHQCRCAAHPKTSLLQNALPQRKSAENAADLPAALTDRKPLTVQPTESESLREGTGSSTADDSRS